MAAPGDDKLNGGDGEDTLIGGPGADTLDGGDGFDIARYEHREDGSFTSDATTGVTIDLSSTPVNGYIVGKGGDAEGDKLKNIENLWGSPYDDVLIGDDNENHLYGRGGDDTLKGKGGFDWLEGGPGADKIDGGDGLDFISYVASNTGVTIDPQRHEGPGRLYYRFPRRGRGRQD